MPPCRPWCSGALKGREAWDGLTEVTGFIINENWIHAVEYPFCMGSWLLLTLNEPRKMCHGSEFQSCFCELVHLRIFK